MRGHYLWLLLGWALPLLLGQWLLGWRIFARNWRPLLFPALLAGVYFTLCDSVAVRQGIWFFDERQILGWRIGPLPIEEVLFFFLTSLLVTQSLLLLLPARFRAP